MNPATITGTVQVAGHTVVGGSIEARAGDQSASTPPSNGAYTLTVNAPETGTVAYALSGYVYLGSTSTLMPLPNPSATATVSAGGTAIANIIVNPASLNVRITVTGGEVRSFYLNAYGSGWTRWASTSVTGASTLMPVLANSSIQVHGTLTLTDGRQFALTSQNGISVGEGEQVDVSWTVDAASAGAIAGTVTLAGAQDISQTYVYAYGPTNRGTTANATTGAYAMPDLPPGSYYMYAYLYRTGGGYFQPPASAFTGGTNYVSVVLGQTTPVNITANAAYLTGGLTLTGTQSVANLTSATVYLNGVSGSPTSGGFAYVPVALPAGEFNALVSDGPWSPYYWSLTFNQLGGYQYLSIVDYSTFTNPVTPPGQASASFALGTVDIAFSVAGGRTLSNPQLFGSCTQQNGNLYFSPSSYLYVRDVLEATLKIIGLDGHCTLNAFATVDGSRVSFGQVSFDITAGTHKVIGIGGPSVAVSSPAANSTLGATGVTVTGTATGESAITGVTVNGVAASTLTPTNNSSDPNEVSFSVPLTLVSGDNTIETVVIDTNGKTASDSRVVTVTITTVTVTVTASSPTVAYGSAVPTITPSYAGFVDGDTAAVLTTPPTCTTDYTAASAAGSTPATSCSGASASGYVFTYVAGTVTVEQREATVTAGDGTKVYGEADQTISATETGFLTDDGITVSATRASGEVVGSYVTSPTAAGALLVNYDVTYVTGSFGITPAPLTVVANNQTRHFTAPNPPLDGTLTGAVAGDGITAAYSTTAEAGSPVGTHPITPSLVDPNGRLVNYAVTSTPGTLTITNTAPVCEAERPMQMLWPPNHQLVTFNPAPAATDGDGDPLTIRVVSIFQGEPTNTTGDGNTAVDGFGVGTSTAQVRAERTGDPKNPGNGRVYYVTFTATDPAGANCTSTTTVGVPHDQGQRRIPIGEEPLFDSTVAGPPPAAPAAKGKK